MFKINDWRTIERLIYWVLWLVILFMPLVFWDYTETVQRSRIIQGWIRILPFLLIFLIHHNLLLPLLLLKNRIGVYFMCLLGTIFLINYLFIYNHWLHEFFRQVVDIEPVGRGSSLPSSPEMNMPHEGGGGMRGRGSGMSKGNRFGFGQWKNPTYIVFTYNIVLSVLIVGFNAAFRFSTKWMKEEQNRKEQEKEHLQSKLTFLQHQVSPHFFMNTLNNIHALIDYNQADAKEAVLRLSKLMRYLLYESERGITTLQKEIEFLNSYINLMRLRIDDSVDLRVEFPAQLPVIEIPPLIFVSFIENAFKHGVSYREKSFIHLKLEIIEKNIHFVVLNSKTSMPLPDDGYNGLGIVNARKRLDLLFGERYTLIVTQRDNEFEIDLTFPYHENKMSSY